MPENKSKEIIVDRLSFFFLFYIFLRHGNGLNIIAPPIAEKKYPIIFYIYKKFFGFKFKFIKNLYRYFDFTEVRGLALEVQIEIIKKLSLSLKEVLPRYSDEQRQLISSDLSMLIHDDSIFLYELFLYAKLNNIKKIYISSRGVFKYHNHLNIFKDVNLSLFPLIFSLKNISRDDYYHDRYYFRSSLKDLSNNLILFLRLPRFYLNFFYKLIKKISTKSHKIFVIEMRSRKTPFNNDLDFINILNSDGITSTIFYAGASKENSSLQDIAHLHSDMNSIYSSLTLNKKLNFISLSVVDLLLFYVFSIFYSFRYKNYLANVILEKRLFENYFIQSNIKLTWSSVEGPNIHNLSVCLASSELSIPTAGTSFSMPYTLEGGPLKYYRSQYFFCWSERHQKLLINNQSLIKEFIISGYPSNLGSEESSEPPIDLDHWLILFENVTGKDLTVSTELYKNFISKIIDYLNLYQEWGLVIKSKKESFFRELIEDKKAFDSLVKEERIIFNNERGCFNPFRVSVATCIGSSSLAFAAYSSEIPLLTYDPLDLTKDILDKNIKSFISIKDLNDFEESIIKLSSNKDREFSDFVIKDLDSSSVIANRIRRLIEL